MERSGKTSLAVWMALQSWALGKKVYANFPLYFGSRTYDDGTTVDTLAPFGLHPDGCESPHLLDMGVLLTKDLKSCEVFIDEAHSWFDCRDSPSLGNRVMSWFLLQSGKRDINIYYIAHDPNMLDKRIVRNLKMQFFCEWVGDIKHPQPHDHIHVYMVARNIAQVPPISEFLVYPRPLYDMFDTNKLVPLDPSVEGKLKDAFELEEGPDGELRTVRVRRSRGRRKGAKGDEEGEE